MSTSIKVREEDKKEFERLQSEEEIDKIRKLQSDWGVVTSEEEIDEILYKKPFFQKESFTKEII